jgi:serine protease Do
MNWSWTGLQLQPLNDFKRNMYFEGKEGVIVAETDPDSPARRAGVLPRDRVLRVNTQTVTGMTEEDLPAIRRLFGMLPKGVPATIELLRDGKPLTIALSPREKGKVEGDELDCPRWDLTLKTINQFDNPDLYFYRKTGVFIFGVKYPGNAATASLQTHDIILKIGDTEVSSLEQVKTIHKACIDRVEAEPRVLFTVLRNGLMRQVVLDFAREYDKE